MEICLRYSDPILEVANEYTQICLTGEETVFKISQVTEKQRADDL